MYIKLQQVPKFKQIVYDYRVHCSSLSCTIIYLKYVTTKRIQLKNKKV